MIQIVLVGSKNMSHIPYFPGIQSESVNKHFYLSNMIISSNMKFADTIRKVSFEAFKNQLIKIYEIQIMAAEISPCH